MPKPIFFVSLNTSLLPPFSYGEEMQLIMENNKIHPDQPNFILTDKDISFDIQNCKTILYSQLRKMMESLKLYFPEVFQKGLTHPSYEPYRFLKKGAILILDQDVSEDKRECLSFRENLLETIRSRLEGKAKDLFTSRYPSLQKFVDYVLPSQDPFLTEDELNLLVK